MKPNPQTIGSWLPEQRLTFFLAETRVCPDWAVYTCHKVLIKSKSSDRCLEMLKGQNPHRLSWSLTWTKYEKTWGKTPVSWDQWCLLIVFPFLTLQWDWLFFFLIKKMIPVIHIHNWKKLDKEEEKSTVITLPRKKEHIGLYSIFFPIM